MVPIPTEYPKYSINSCFNTLILNHKYRKNAILRTRLRACGLLLFGRQKRGQPRRRRLSPYCFILLKQRYTRRPAGQRTAFVGSGGKKVCGYSPKAANARARKHPLGRLSGAGVKHNGIRQLKTEHPAWILRSVRTLRSVLCRSAEATENILRARNGRRLAASLEIKGSAGKAEIIPMKKSRHNHTCVGIL